MATAESERKILIAVDGSPQSKHAVEYAVSNILRQGDHVLVVHAQEPLLNYIAVYEADMVISPFNDPKIEMDRQRAGLAIAKECAKPIQEAHFSCETRLLVGNPRESILEYVEQEGASLVIVGSRGMGTLKRTLVGSTSDFLVHHCKVPVLVVRPVEEKRLDAPAGDASAARPEADVVEGHTA